MSTFLKVMLVPALVVAVAVGAGIAASGGGGGSPLAQVAPTTSTVEDAATAGTTARSPEAEDVSGPCDEAEHAGDPRCVGAPAADHRRGGNAGPGSVSSGRDADDRAGEHRGGDDHGGRGHDDSSSGHGGSGRR